MLAGLDHRFRVFGVRPGESQVGRLADSEFPRCDSTRETTSDDSSRSDRVELKARTADVLTLISCTSKSSLHPFDEEAPFELGDGSDDREDCLAEW